jgi:phage baseplate assembly protein W
MQHISQPIYFTRGWLFPPQFEAQGKTVKMAIDQDNIRQSLMILLSTVPGERFMHPTYGCDLRRFLFQDVNQGFMTRLKEALLDAITRYESRIKINDIVIALQDSQNGHLTIDLQYTILATVRADTLRYTLNLKEGSIG